MSHQSRRLPGLVCRLSGRLISRLGIAGSTLIHTTCLAAFASVLPDGVGDDYRPIGIPKENAYRRNVLWGHYFRNPPKYHPCPVREVPGRNSTTWTEEELGGRAATSIASVTIELLGCFLSVYMLT